MLAYVFPSQTTPGLNKAPNKTLDPLTREFVKLILSKEGQEGAVKDGYFPLPAEVTQTELMKIK